MNDDDLSASQLAELLGNSLLRIRSAVDRLKVSADEALLFLLLGSLNFKSDSGVSIFAPISLDDIFLRLENCPRDRLRQQLKRLQAKQLVKATWHGFVICDPVLWREMGMAIAEMTNRQNINASVPNQQLQATSERLATLVLALTDEVTMLKQFLR